MHGWVERAIFANGRVDALSDISLGVIDYTVPTAPRTVSEVTLARNITGAMLVGDQIAELDEDYWGNDAHVTLRLLPQSDADDPSSDAPALTLDGQKRSTVCQWHPSLCRHGCFDSGGVQCDDQAAVQGAGCQAVTERVEVIDLSSGTPQKRGQIDLPAAPSYFGGIGFQPFDWYEGADIVAIGDALAVRRWTGWDAQGTSQAPLYLVDLSDPDAPALASTTLVTEPHAWWGQLLSIDGKLYASEYVWSSAFGTTAMTAYVRYYIQNIDISDRKNPSVGARINTPGVLIGGSSTDTDVLYTLDWRWNGNQPQSWLETVRLKGGSAAYQGGVALNGDSGASLRSAARMRTHRSTTTMTMRRTCGAARYRFVQIPFIAKRFRDRRHERGMGLVGRRRRRSRARAVGLGRPRLRFVSAARRRRADLRSLRSR